MSINVDPIDITAGIPVNITLEISPTQLRAVKFTNRTVFDIAYTGPGHNGTLWVPSNTEWLFEDMANANQGSIALSGYNTTAVSPPPQGVVLVSLYTVDEPRPSGTWPISIPAAQVQTSVNQSTLTNDGSASGSTIIEITPAGSTGSTFLFLNDGTLAIATVVAGSPVDVIQVIPGGDPILKLGSSTKSVEIEHVLNVLGNLGVLGSASLDSGNITTNGSGTLNVFSIFCATAANGIKFKSNPNTCQIIADNASDMMIFDAPTGTRRMTINSTGLHMTSSGAGLDAGSGNSVKLGNGQTISGISSFTGAATGTYNHNFGSTPGWVIPMQNVAGSQTMGYDSLTSTQVHITSFSGSSFKALCLG